jgi:HSP20 family protein
MTKEKPENKTDEGKTRLMVRRPFDDIFENFRRDIENVFVTPFWPRSWDLRFPSFGTELDTRMPLCDMVDKGDKYEILLEIPGIPKEKLDIKATKNRVEITGQQEKKSEEKGRNYVYNERSYQSFSRRIPVPEEIVPSKIEAKMQDGVLKLELAKKTPTKVEEEETKVNVK